MEFEAIGTHWKIDLNEDLTEARRSGLLAAIMQRIDIFDKNYSRFRTDSLVTKISQEIGTYTLPADAEPMLRLYENIYHLTGGLVTPLIGKLMEQAGYDANYSLVPGELHHPPKWEDAIEFKSPNILITKQPVLLDFGALGKGYLIDIVADIIREHGIQNFCVDAGGDILHRDAKNLPLRIGLEHPQHLEKVIGVAALNNKSLCGSAGNRRAWANFHHIINPHTLESPRNILATWATANTTLLADAIASCLFFTSPEKLAKYYTFDYLIMYADSSVKHSKNFPNELFVK